MSTTEVVKPEIVSGPDPDAQWDEPCPNCHQSWSAGPEGARWGRQHCWQCGYTPQSGVPVVPGVPQQPDWQALINNAVREALSSPAQLQAIANTQALGREGLANLAAEQQANLGMSQ